MQQETQSQQQTYTLYGIWMDHSDAFVIKTNKVGGNFEFKHLKSDVEANSRGGEGGEHFTIKNQNKSSERRENELHAFCKEISSMLNNADEILVFGPGQAKFALEKMLKDIKALAPKLKEPLTTDKLSEAEMKEFLKKHLGLPRL